MDLSYALILLLFQPDSSISCEQADQTTISKSFDSSFTEKCFFVDKSEMIGTFFNQHNGTFSYITCPYGFGKTHSLLMLKSFANIEVDEATCRPRPLTSSRNYQLFKGLKIFQNLAIINAHLGQYGVVHLHLNITFRNKPITMQNLIQEMREKIRNTVSNDLSWLVNLMDRMIAKEVNMTEYTFKGSEYSFLRKALDGLLNEYEIRYCLLNLAEIYHNFFKKPVIVLIDDYDYVALEALTNSNINPITYYRFINEMIRAVVPDGNHSIIRYGLLMGRTRLPLNIGALGKKVIHYRFLNPHRFSKHFGFCENEVQKIYKRCNLTEEETQKAQDLYDGYTTSNRFTRVYNPYSVVQYLQQRQTSSDNLYWCYGQQHTYISAFLKSSLYRQEIAKLCESQSVKYDSLGHYMPNALEALMELRNTKYTMVADSHLHILLSYSFENGLLCYTRRRNSYVLPNTEVRALLLVMNDLYEQSQKRSAAVINSTANAESPRVA